MLCLPDPGRDVNVKTVVMSTVSVGAAVCMLADASVGGAGVTTVGVGTMLVAVGELGTRTDLPGSATSPGAGAAVGVGVSGEPLPRQALNANNANAKTRTSTAACLRPTRMRRGGAPERITIVGVAESDRPPRA